MRLFALLLLTSCLALAIPAAHSDTVVYQLNAANGDSLSYSSNSGFVTSGQIIPIQVVSTCTFLGVTCSELRFYSFSFGDVFQVYVNNSTGIQNFFFPVGTLSAFGTYATSSGTNLGTLTISGIPTAVAPEPSSLLFLGTGLLTMTGVVRRRFVRT